MPAKKSIKKVVKKKQVKKSIRSKIKKHNEQNNNEMSLNPSLMNPSLPTQATNISQLHGQNNLRAQLLARAAFAPTLGFTPQQYGNFTNERRIEQLRNDNNTMNSQITNDKATIATLEKQNEELKKEVAESKKTKKNAQKEHDKTQHEMEMMDDELHEAERIEMKNERKKKKVLRTKEQLAEVNRENKIGELKKMQTVLDTKVHEQKLKKEQLTEEIQKNTEYQEFQKKISRLCTISE